MYIARLLIEQAKDYRKNPLVSAKIAYFMNVEKWGKKYKNGHQRAVAAAVNMAKQGRLKPGKWQQELREYYKKHPKK